MQVRVWNDNDHPHSEKYKGDKLEIAPHGYIEMDQDEANQFLGQYTPIVRRGDGTPDPRFFKRLRIECLGKKAATPPNPLMFHATGQIAKSIEELKELQGHYRHLMIKEDGDEKLDGLAKENEDLKARLERLESLLAGSEKVKAKRAKREQASEVSEDQEQVKD
jgi:hypothetical protein